MDRRDIAWGLTKIAGLYLLWVSLDSFFTLLQGVIMADQFLPGGARSMTGNIGAFLGWKGLVTGILGVYLLANGRILMRLMGQGAVPGDNDR